MSDVRSRLAVVDDLLADPPAVHTMDFSADPELGVWSTEPSCYRLLAEHCGPGTRTLETGCGASTVLFTAFGAEHVCCTAGQAEADRVVDYCRSHGFDTTRLRFEIGYSHRTLPPLEAAGLERDLVLIDGSHGFPQPIVDWLYAAGTLVRNGILVIDDINLPAVRLLCRFLDQDPRWEPIGGTEKWKAFRRHSEGMLSEDWIGQPWYVTRTERAKQLAQGGRAKLRRLWQLRA